MKIGFVVVVVVVIVVVHHLCWIMVSIYILQKKKNNRIHAILHSWKKGGGCSHVKGARMLVVSLTDVK